MADSTFNTFPNIIKTANPTVAQLQLADIVIAQIHLVGTTAYTEVVNAFGGNNSIGLTDYNGEKITISTVWNKTNGTLTATSESRTVAVSNVALIYLNSHL